MNTVTHPGHPGPQTADGSFPDPLTLQAERPDELDANWQLSAIKLNRNWLTAIIVLGVASLATLLYLGDPQQTIHLIRESNWGLLLLALLIHYSGFAIRGLRWKLLLNALGHSRGYVYCTGLLISGWFVSAIIPARAGDILRIGVLRSSGSGNPLNARNASVINDGSMAHDGSEARRVPIADGLSSILLERVLDMMAILLLGASFGFMVLRAQLPSWVLSLYGTTVALLVALGLTLLILPRVWVWLGSLSSQSFWQKGIRFGSELTEKIALLAQAPKTAMITVGLSLYIWLCDAFLLWLVMGSVDALIGAGLASFGRPAFVALTVDVIAAVPLTPGGIGQIETAYGALLSLLSLPTAKLPAIILLTRFISYWSFLLFSGLVTFLMLGLPKRR